MCEFLIKNDIGTEFDPGDFITCKEDGWQWGKEENPLTATVPHFWILKIPGMSVESGAAFLERIADAQDNRYTVKQRRYKFDTSIAPQYVKNRIASEGEYTMDSTTFEVFINNKGN